MADGTSLLDAPIATATENPAVVSQDSPNRDPALGEPEPRFLDRGGQERS
jgi:hypothetical protein